MFKVSLFAHFFISVSVGWDLSYYNLSSTYYVSSVAVYVNRAFLALPRSACPNNISSPTLVEASFYNEQFLLGTRPFFLDAQQWGKCWDLQDAISLDMETLRARLWVLDKGSANCSAKLVIYNLFQKINYTLEAPEDVERRKMTSLLVDSEVRLGGARGYIGLDGENHLLVFSFSEFKWWKVVLTTENSMYPISTKYLTISRKTPVLYLTGGDERAIFSIQLTEIRREFEEDEDVEVNVTFLGEKLGASSGLVADYKDGLSYYLIRDYVIVRWNTRSPPRAEYYNVLAQSYQSLPHVSQLFTGPHNGIWALANPGNPDDCSQENDVQLLEKRLVKLLKYNIF